MTGPSGAGRTPEVGRIAIASEITSAATPMTKTAATPLPINQNDLRSRWPASTTWVAAV
jgi:hypothetical protein